MKRALVIHPFGIGDVIFSFPLVHQLKLSGYAVDYLCNERTICFVKKNPDIEACYEFNRDAVRALRKMNIFQWAKEMWSWVHRIKVGGYECVFDLSMGREYALLAMLAGVKKRIGFDFKSRGRFLTHKIQLEGFDGQSVRMKIMELLTFVEVESASSAEYPVFPLLESEWFTGWRGQHPDLRPVAVIAPGGGASWGKDAHYKQWSADRFSEVGRVLRVKYHYDVIVTGSPDEMELVRWVADKIPDAIILAEEDITRVFRVLQTATLFIGNDGGLLHLADLAQIPLVGIYGPVDEKTYGPTVRKQAIALSADVECRPCYSKFIFPTCEHQKICQKSISVDEVLAAIRRVLANTLNSKLNP